MAVVVVAIVAAFENWQVEVVEVAHCYQYCNWVPWIAMKFEEVEFETAVVVETVETNKDLLFVVTKVAKRQIFKRLKKWTKDINVLTPHSRLSPSHPPNLPEKKNHPPIQGCGLTTAHI